jgi:methyl-accepting chemotaxis protein
MERDHERPVNGPDGTLTERVGDHVAAAELLIRQSHQAVDLVAARVLRTLRRVQHTSRQVQEGADSVRLSRRSAAEAAEHFLQVKQRELATHLMAAELHEQAAALQDRLGHPERASQARAHAGHARELYRLATTELADYQARIAEARTWAGKPR